jgi:hypothetical protein
MTSDAESSQADTQLQAFTGAQDDLQLDLKSAKSGRSDKKQKQLRLRRRLSKIAE